MTTFITIILSLLAVYLFSTLAIAAFSFAPWLPARQKDLRRILSVINPQTSETLYELGCGNGRVACYLAKHSEAKVVGLELAWPLYIVCVFRKIISRQKNLKFEWQNLFTADLAKADVIYIFGIPRTIAKKLKQKLEKELKPGTRVISYVFKVEGWEPEVIDKPSKRDNSIYVYRR